MTKKSYVTDLVEVTFVGRKKVSERIVKKNLTKNDLEIIAVFRKSNEK